MCFRHFLCCFLHISHMIFSYAVLVYFFHVIASCFIYSFMMNSFSYLTPILKGPASQNVMSCFCFESISLLTSLCSNTSTHLLLVIPSNPILNFFFTHASDMEALDKICRNFCFLRSCLQQAKANVGQLHTEYLSKNGMEKN